MEKEGNAITLKHSIFLGSSKNIRLSKQPMGFNSAIFCFGFGSKGRYIIFKNLESLKISISYPNKRIKYYIIYYIISISFNL